MSLLFVCACVSLPLCVSLPVQVSCLLSVSLSVFCLCLVSGEAVRTNQRSDDRCERVALRRRHLRHAVQRSMHQTWRRATLLAWERYQAKSGSNTVKVRDESEEPAMVPEQVTGKHAHFEAVPLKMRRNCSNTGSKASLMSRPMTVVSSPGGRVGEWT